MFTIISVITSEVMIDVSSLPSALSFLPIPATKKSYGTSEIAMQLLRKNTAKSSIFYHKR